MICCFVCRIRQFFSLRFFLQKKDAIFGLDEALAMVALDISGREVKTNGRMETNIPGLYVAGDLAGQVDSVKLNLIATGYAQAAVAVNIAKNFIDPNARIFPGHSSEMSI